jgi:N-hydroxyarylamine O-acetyltransferase
MLASDVGTSGDHMLLLVALDQPYLADVGFGNGLYEPLPLREGDHAQNGFVYGLARSGLRWRFVNQPTAGDSFEFDLAPRRLADFAERCQWLQTSPESGFVRNVVCHRFSDDGRIFTLRGAVLTPYQGPDKASRTLTDADDFLTTLRDTFPLDLPEAATLWPAILTRHAAWLAKADE